MLVARFRRRHFSIRPLRHFTVGHWRYGERVQLHHVNILNRLAPITQVTRRTRLSDPWFVDDCQARKRETHRLDKRYRTCRASSDRASWTSSVRKKHKYFAKKSHSFWTNKIESLKCDSRRRWTTVNHLMSKKRTLSRQSMNTQQTNSCLSLQRT